MEKLKVLITGGNGLLGSNMVFHASDRYRVVASSLNNPVSSKAVETVQMDITDAAQVDQVVQHVRPDVIFHCAAETRVDYCEKHPDHAHNVNAQGTRNVARVAAAVGATIVYISSDSVFGGERGGYEESDPLNPLNVYSKTKVAGERFVQQTCTRCLIVRSNIYGWNMKPKESLAEWALHCLRREECLSGFCDVIFAPLLVNDLAEILFDMVEKKLQGLYHVGSSDHISKYEFICSIARIFGLDSNLVSVSQLEGAHLEAPRPKSTYLNVFAVERDLGRSMPTVDQGLRQFYELEQSGYVAALRSLA